MKTTLKQHQKQKKELEDLRKVEVGVEQENHLEKKEDLTLLTHLTLKDLFFLASLISLIERSGKWHYLASCTLFC